MRHPAVYRTAAALLALFVLTALTALAKEPLPCPRAFDDEANDSPDAGTRSERLKAPARLQIDECLAPAAWWQLPETPKPALPPEAPTGAGHSRAVSAALPRAPTAPYRPWQSHDEADRHRREARRILDRFRRLLRRPELPRAELRRTLAELEGQLRRGREAAERTVAIFAAVRVALADPASVGWARGTRYARVRVRVSREGHWDALLPLPASEGSRDPRNRALLAERVEALATRSQSSLAELHVGQLAFERFFAARTRREARAVAEALFESLEPSGPAPLPPKGLAPAAARFGGRLDRCWERLAAEPSSGRSSRGAPNEAITFTRK